MTTLYTVARRDGENREYNLTLREAAQAILHYDGWDYQIKKELDGSRRLWTRQEVANREWASTTFLSYQDDAEGDIFGQVVKMSRDPQWRGLVAEEQEIYRRSLDAMRAEEDDPECIERIDAELTKMKGDTPITLTLTERERDTVLAALRYWQREGLRSDGHERDIATNGRHGAAAALTTDEIDALCEKINT